jgi:hypothetical protein
VGDIKEQIVAYFNTCL